MPLEPRCLRSHLCIIMTKTSIMHAVEFTTELSADPVLPVPKEAAAQLPKSGKARVIVLTGDENAPEDEIFTSAERRNQLADEF